MDMSEIRGVARAVGVSPGRRGKVDLIRDIQTSEGNFDCFATAYEGVCDQSQCLWREECFVQSKKVAKRG